MRFSLIPDPPVRGLGMGLSGVGGGSSGTDTCLCGGLFFFIGTGGGTASAADPSCGEKENMETCGHESDAHCCRFWRKRSRKMIKIHIIIRGWGWWVWLSGREWLSQMIEINLQKVKFEVHHTDINNKLHHHQWVGLQERGSGQVNFGGNPPF